MKSEYTTPGIYVEALDKVDVLLSSATNPTEPVTPQKVEKENRYGDFISFALEPKNWFD